MKKQYKWKELIEEVGLKLSCPNCHTDMTNEFLELVGRIHNLFAKKSWTGPGNEARRKAQGRKMAIIAKNGKKGIKHKISEEVSEQRARNINEFRQERLENRSKMVDNLTEHPEYVEHLRRNADGRQNAQAKKKWLYYKKCSEWLEGIPQLFYGTKGKDVFIALTGIEDLKSVFEKKKRYRNKQLYIKKYTIEDNSFYNISCFYMNQLVTLGWVKDLDIDGLYPEFDSNTLYLQKKTGRDDIKYVKVEPEEQVTEDENENDNDNDKDVASTEETLEENTEDNSLL